MVGPRGLGIWLLQLGWVERRDLNPFEPLIYNEDIWSIATGRCGVLGGRGGTRGLKVCKGDRQGFGRWVGG